ncbi:MAG: capsule assembly Wzi family protein [Treponema sp.]|nr:capsule assembly Wzi family protein [Treponema sp.]
MLLTNILFSSPYDMILAGDPVLEDILYLSLESGKSILSFTAPFAPHEIKRFLDSIDVSNLSIPAQEAFNRVNRRLNPQAPISISGDSFLFMLNINSTIETRTRFNSDISWLPQYPKTPPLLSLPLRFYFSDFVQLYMEPIIAVNPVFYNNQKYFEHNVLQNDLDNLEQNMPLRAFMAIGNSWWNFQLGRDRLSYGTGQMGNLAISDNPHFYEFARLSFFTDFFKYSVLVSQMPLDITGIYDMTNATDNTLIHTTHRYFYLHRLDFSLFNKLSIGLMEGVMVGNSPLEIRYLNPMMIFHSFYSWLNYPPWDAGNDKPEGSGDMNGSLFSLEINWNVLESLAVYGQFVMNQFATNYKIKRWGTQPNGLGYLAGVRHSRSFGEWGSVFFVEFIYTDPYLYMNPSPFASFIHMRYISGGINSLLYSFVGFPRDAIAATMGVSLFYNNIIHFLGKFTLVTQGEHKIYWDWKNTAEAYNAATPTGTAETKLITSLDARYSISSYITLKGGISGIFSFNNTHLSGSNIFGGQTEVSINFHY